MVVKPEVPPGILAAGIAGAVQPKARPAFLEILRLSSFRHLLLSNGLSSMGKNVLGIATAWLVLEMTGSNLWVGIVNGTPAIAIVLFSLLGGVLADRLDRRTILLWSRITLSGLSFLAAFLIGSGKIDIWQLMALVTLILGAYAVDDPVGQTIVLGLVGKERLLGAMSMITLMRNIGMVIGPSVIGVLIAKHGVDTALYLLSGAYLAAFAVMSLVPRSPAQGKGELHILRDLGLGIAYIRKTPRLTWLVSLSATVPLAGVFFGMLPIYARNVLKVGPEGLGIMVAAYSLGGIVGSMYQILRGRVPHPGLVVVLTGGTYGIGMLAVAFSHSFPVSLVFTFTTGMSAALWLNTMSALVQTSTDERMQGRVMSIFTLGVQLYSLGWLIGGVLTTLFGSQGTLIVAGLAFAGFHVFAYLKSAELQGIN